MKYWFINGLRKCVKKMKKNKNEKDDTSKKNN